MQTGQSLLEILISLFLISTAIFGALKLDLLAQQVFHQTHVIQNTQQWQQNVYELLQNQPSALTQCRSCATLHQNQKIIATLQKELQHEMPGTKLETHMMSNSQIKIKICLEDNLCQEQVIQV
jgi:Tfp pilus assembly protein PilV